MATGATGQLGLALPVQGELSGTWGDTVNNGITQYTNIAIAGTLTLTNDGAVTLANTTGDASASNITSTLTGAGTVTAQFAIVRVTGTLTTAKVVTAPSYSKTYTVVNAATGGIVTFKASGQTGVSVAVGETAFVYFNGTDYVKVSGTVAVASFQTSLGGLTPSTATTGVVTLAGTLNTTSGGTGLTSFTAGDVPYYASGSVLSKLAIGTAGQFLTSTGTAPQWSTLSGVAVTTFSAGTTGFTPSSATSGAITLAGTLATTNGGTGLTSFTSGGVVYASSSSALATGSALTFDGTNLGVNGRFVIDGIVASAPANGGMFRLSNESNYFTGKTTGSGGAVLSNGDGTATIQLYKNSPTSYMVFEAGNGTEGMRLTSTGLGIGTSSPSSPLSFANSVGQKIRFYNNLTGYGIGVESSEFRFVTDSSAKFTWVNGTYSGGTTQMTLDASGNLGLGVTPSAWISSYRTFSVGDSGFISSRIGASVNDVAVGVNWFRNSGGSFVYKANGFATNYGQQDGVHSWFNAPNNTSGASAALTFTQAMTLGSTGDLILGGTDTSVGKMVVRYTSNGTTPTAPAQAGLNLWGDSSVRLLFGTYTGSPYAAYIQTSNTGSPSVFPLALNPDGGNVGIGTNSPTSKLGVNGVIQVTSSGNPSSSAGLEIGYGAVTASRTSLQSYNRTGSAYLGADYNALDHYFYISGTERFRIGSSGQIGLSGANYGTSGQVLTSGGSGAAPTWTTVGGGGLTLGTPVSPTSSTSIDFTGIPAGTKQIIITFRGISTDGSSAKLIQIGDSGGIETSGYVSCGYRILGDTPQAGYASAGYAIYSESSGHTLSGSIILTLLSSSANTWVAQGILTGNTNSNFLISGEKSLSATCDRVRITTELGTQNYVAGSINIAYM
jgi:hypothetical protein